MAKRTKPKRIEADGKASPPQPAAAKEQSHRTLPCKATLLFAAASFVSAGLLFSVEPMFAKMVLPLLGGAPAVWITCLVFYQAALLGGYVYAHFSLKWLGPGRQALLHLAAMSLTWRALPLAVNSGWTPRPDAYQAFSLWALLVVSVGFPFLVVSASAPILQAWFARTNSQSARDPYFLYAASNLGSLLALLGYPLVIEPCLTLAEQTHCWTWGYGLLMALFAACAVWLWRSPQSRGVYRLKKSLITAEPPTFSPSERRPVPRRRLRWLILSLIPSSLLSGVTTHITTDITPMPLLWVIPLALYLLSFVLVFSRRQIIPMRWIVRAEPYLIVAAAGSLLWTNYSSLEIVIFRSLHLLAFFAIAMVCHGRIAADRPASHYLTEYYLWMSLGGVLGGLFNALFAPILFSTVLEYPLMLAAACAVRPPSIPPLPRPSIRNLAIPVILLLFSVACAWLTRAGGLLADWRYADVPATGLFIVALSVLAALFLIRRPVSLALGVLALSAISLLCATKDQVIVHVERSFFGVLRVEHDPVFNDMLFWHGSTRHGVQGIDPLDRHEPWSYYHRQGPLGEVFTALAQRGTLSEIGVLGLGTGAIAAYGQPGQRITYYEIDPAVERIARQYFSYLADCRAALDVIIGDARLSLVHGPPRQFDLLIVDVFNSDSVPVHLITREALQVYLQHLSPQGVIAVHISSRYFHLAPVLGDLAGDAGLTALIDDDSHGGVVGLGKDFSTWVVMARKREDLGNLAAEHWKVLEPRGGRLWTDDFSNILGVLSWEFDWKSFWSAEWWHDHRAESHENLARALADLGRMDQAAVHFEKALEIEPRNAEFHNSFALALARNERYGEAIPEFRRGLEIAPENAETHHDLAVALMSGGHSDEALAEFHKALEINPRFAKAHYFLALALLKLERFEEAAAEMQKARDDDPNFPNVERILEDIQRRARAKSINDPARK